MKSQFNVQKVKQDFPIFTNRMGLVYLDSAATSQKPQQVIQAVTDFYTHSNSNIHRGIYDLSNDATNLYESARKKIAVFIGANDPSEIIFTANASEAINVAAYGFARKHLQKNDYIVISEMEHHSNIVPWLRLQKEIGIKVVFLPVTADFRLDYKWLLAQGIEKKRIKLVALTHASNVLGTINPIEEIVDFLQANDIHAKLLIDAAQSVGHMPINVNTLKCDFLAFSSHKMLGPSGVGVLFAKKELLEDMDPMMVGSHMIKTVTKTGATYAKAPEKFEVGTGRLEAVVGLGAAVDYLSSIGMEQITKEEAVLTDYVLQKLAPLENLTLYGSKSTTLRLGVFSFGISGVHPHDTAEILNRMQICTRAGHHCCQVLMQKLNVPATVRASFYLYNTKEDADMLIEGIREVNRVFRRG